MARSTPMIETDRTVEQKSGYAASDGSSADHHEQSISELVSNLLESSRRDANRETVKAILDALQSDNVVKQPDQQVSDEPPIEVSESNTSTLTGTLKLFVAEEQEIWSEIGWEKRTPKSDKLERRRCQDEAGPARKIHEGIPPGSSEAGNGREAIIAGGSPPVVPGAIDVRVLGEGTKGRQTGRCRQDVQALD